MLLLECVSGRSPCCHGCHLEAHASQSPGQKRNLIRCLLLPAHQRAGPANAGRRLDWPLPARAAWSALPFSRFSLICSYASLAVCCFGPRKSFSSSLLFPPLLEGCFFSVKSKRKCSRCRRLERHAYCNKDYRLASTGKVTVCLPVCRIDFMLSVPLSSSLSVFILNSF